MNDIFKETFGTPDTSKQTPIEIALGVDANGMTTAKKLYEFLDLDQSHYAKWFKKNILENNFAEENADYWVFAQKCENLQGGRPTQDARLTASFAKKLSMVSKSPKGEAARNYFVGVENGVKKIIKVPLTDRPGEVARLINSLTGIMKSQCVAPEDIAENAKMICDQYGIRTSDKLVRKTEYRQLSLWDSDNKKE